MFELTIAGLILIGFPAAIVIYVALVHWQERLTAYPLEQPENWGSQDIDRRSNS
jgi:hypothetical protein